MTPEKILALNRGKVDKITYEIIALIGKRDAVVRRITRAKKQLGLPMFDSKREKQLMKKARIMAKRAGVDPKLVEKITTLIMAHSRGLI